VDRKDPLRQLAEENTRSISLKEPRNKKSVFPPTERHTEQRQEHALLGDVQRESSWAVATPLVDDLLVQGADLPVGVLVPHVLHALGFL